MSGKLTEQEKTDMLAYEDYQRKMKEGKCLSCNEPVHPKEEMDLITNVLCSYHLNQAKKD